MGGGLNSSSGRSVGPSVGPPSLAGSLGEKASRGREGRSEPEKIEE